MLHQQFVDIALGTKSLTRTLFFFYILLKITYMNSRNLSLCYPSSPMGGSTTIVQTSSSASIFVFYLIACYAAIWRYEINV